MENQECLILCVCDIHHTKNTQQIISVFTDKKLLIHNAMKHAEESPDGELTPEELDGIMFHNQTQGREYNYIILTEKLNPTDGI